MYPVFKTEEDVNALFHRKQDEDYGPKHGLAYQPPPVIKEFAARESFVHACAESKYKQNHSHLANLYKKSRPKTRAQLLKQLTAAKVDFRLLTLLKNTLFDSDSLQ